jgi:hypothetical protein
MSTSRTSAATKPARKRRRAAPVRCAMPACTGNRVSGKAHCAAHVPVARDRIRMAAGDSAWS